ncbi:MAG TPA: TetR/AcrR family transcriptional regulator [Jiangellaceae bacterium]|nr:TetR/AcrR family transcriptional regulator [Jiangellaceae bacterium]
MSRARPAGRTPYAAAQAASKASLRRLLLDTASSLLERDGPDALTMRRIAGEVGCSTSVLYTMFGGKPGIAEALWREGFERLGAALEAVTGAGPLKRLAAMGRAYRANALANRSYYTVMFQRPIPGFEPSPEAYQASLVPLRALADTVADCIDAGVFRAEDPMHIAGVLWAATHGAVSLELAGYEGAVDAEHRFDDVNAAAAAWFMTPGRAPSE